ncbi:neurofilament medium polypeptide [Scophthalmus maximus]|uniref:neurofilament medium polypeptide n=1 Tax=Scophthalmus maximus TaxID=52904 RepID=UPI001FA869EE|nr:neurofilament medium polypeptide [Scophthalmus maximus]
MLTRWLTFTALLAASASPHTAAAGRGPLTVAPTRRVKGHQEVELTLDCGDGKNAGVVQYWHTPFGDIHTPGLHSHHVEPVFMHQDGSLVVPNSSGLHSGLYYCLLRHTEGTTLWPYELHVGHNKEKNREDLRFRRDAAPEGEEQGQAGVSDGMFAGAVAASVLLTFVLGFGAGALTRARVLRCLGAVTIRIRSARQRLQTDMPNHGTEVPLTTVPPVCDNVTSEMGQVQDGVTMETAVSSPTSFPPDKPQRSFRLKREEQRQSAASLEGRDHGREEERRTEEEEGRSLEEKKQGGEGDAEEEEEREVRGFDLLGDDGGRQTETDEDKHSEDGGESKVDKRQEEEGEVEEAGEQERRSREDGEERRGGELEAEGNEEKGIDKEEEEKETDDGEKEREKDVRRDSQQSSTESEDAETDGKTPEDTERNGIMRGDGGGEAPSPPPRRSRIIRLYQYNEDGQRYFHLPDPPPEDPAPAPRAKQRSLSLTRLNAIMAAASAGPLDRREDGEESPHFQMEI